jgi:TrpR-related protein YerC/YecD
VAKRRPAYQKALFEAIAALESFDEVRAFFKDLLTEAELRELSARWTAARMLSRKESYSKIIEATGLSSTTVARVSKWLGKGAGGYRMVLSRLDANAEIEPDAD